MSETGGNKVQFINNILDVPKSAIIPFIEGDGIGVDIWPAAAKVFDASVQIAYKGERKVYWKEIFAGEKAFKMSGTVLPDETISAIKEHIIAIKGPLTTPVGGGFRSLNVTLRQVLDLYACVRPVRYFKGIPSPVKNPERLNVVIFRENTEDVYCGIEWGVGTEDCKKVIQFLQKEMKKEIRNDSGIGIKPISITGSKRLVKMALEYAVNMGSKSVTLVHKGNIMKYTEGGFREWGYDLAREEFGDTTITEKDVEEKYNGKIPEKRIVIKDRIADSMFQQVLLRPDEYDVIATTNLNGDYLSDACAAQVGGLGLAPGANIGKPYAVFEATHGSSPKHAGQNKANPSSLILSGVMMFNYMGWNEVGELIISALEKTISKGLVTYDLHRQMDNAKLLSTSEFSDAIIQNL